MNGAALITEAPAEFLRWLHAARGYTALNLCAVVEEPWKWTPEYAEWCKEREQQAREEATK